MMFPEGYISCKELQSVTKQSYVIYFHVFEDSRDFITVYLTDSDCFLTAKVSINEIRRIASNVDVAGDPEIISSLRLSVKQEILHFDEVQSELTLPFCNGSKSSELVMKFHIVSNHEEKERCMKFMLFQLARIAEDKWNPHESSKLQLITPTKNDTAYGHTSSLRPSKITTKRKEPGMSIINPGSKRVRKKQGVQYEDDCSDS